MTFFFLQNLLVTVLPRELDHGIVEPIRFPLVNWYEVQPFSTVIDAKP